MTDAPDNPPPEPLSDLLTRRERQVLALLAEGYSAPEIAQQLTVAVSSVKSHVQHLYAKLGASGKRQALTRAAQLGLLGGPPVAVPPAPASPAPAAAPAAPKPALPIQVTRFFGHEAAIAQVQAMLDDWRLVTLTGPGGVGKTRFSLRVAEEVAADSPGWPVVRRAGARGRPRPRGA